MPRAGVKDIHLGQPPATWVHNTSNPHKEAKLGFVFHSPYLECTVAEVAMERQDVPKSEPISVRKELQR